LQVAALYNGTFLYRLHLIWKSGSRERSSELLAVKRTVNNCTRQLLRTITNAASVLATGKVKGVPVLKLLTL